MKLGDSRGKLHGGQVGLSGLIPLRSDGSCGSHAERLDHVSNGQRRSIENQKMTLGSQETY
jgi:hypothetical protein